MRFYLKNVNFALGLVLSATLVMAAATSLFWTPYEPNAMNIHDRMQAPSLNHPLGTDQYGRDQLSRIMVGAVNSIMVGLMTVAIGMGAGMALGLVSTDNARRLLMKELWVGVWNGLIWAIVIAGIAGLWFNNMKLSIIIGFAIVINLIVAAISGASIPLFLRKIGADPALAGSVVLTTITDVIGFFAFLGLASLFLI